MLTLVIRQFEVGDTEAVLTLWRLVFPEYNEPSKPQRDPRANIERKLSTQPELFWLAEYEGHAAGTVMAGYDGHRGWIYTLGVHPEFRRRGVGRALLAHAEAALKALGCPKINLQVSTSNAASRRFYEAQGYDLDAVSSYGKRLT